jgi:Carboxypeptidase regulatory-like domain
VAEGSVTDSRLGEPIDVIGRRRGMRSSVRFVFVRSILVYGLAVLNACSGAAAPAPSGSNPPGGPSGSPIVVSADQAAGRVLTQIDRWPGLGPFDPTRVGQCCGYRVSTSPTGWTVAIEVGWGDCPAGCIYRHEWRYDVQPDGTINELGETGPPVPAGLPGSDISGGSPEPSAAGSSEQATFPAGIRGVALAGPTCPVARPNDPACAERPVTGAVIHVIAGDGVEAATLTTDANGRFAVELPPGAYRLVADDVEGLMRSPEPVTVTIKGSVVDVQLSYDTGIR